jgi:hypothetical protein
MKNPVLPKGNSGVAGINARVLAIDVTASARPLKFLWRQIRFRNTIMPFGQVHVCLRVIEQLVFNILTLCLASSWATGFWEDHILLGSLSISDGNRTVSER